MFRNIISFKCMVILTLLVSMAGCSDKNEVESLKKELAKTQTDLDYWQGRYDAVCLDLRNIKASHRNLDTRLDDVDSSARTIEEQLYSAQQVIQELQIEIENRDATILEMELIISDQEAALQEFLDMLGQTTTGQVDISY
ncbi:MAG: hypothetical protein JXA96_18400 [Sedimentisphaerales bacterium]|nr:hypothetical protein [Sedimentisphaerales bacterium]